MDSLLFILLKLEMKLTRPKNNAIEKSIMYDILEARIDSSVNWQAVSSPLNRLV